MPKNMWFLYKILLSCWSCIIIKKIYFKTCYAKDQSKKNWNHAHKLIVKFLWTVNYEQIGIVHANK